MAAQPARPRCGALRRAGVPEHAARGMALHERDADRPGTLRAARCHADAGHARSGRIAVVPCVRMQCLRLRRRQLPAGGLSSPRALSGNLRIESIAELRTTDPARLAGRLGQLADVKRHPFVALGSAFLDDGACLFVPRGVHVAQPVHVVQLASGAAPDRVCHPRLLVVAEPGSHVTLIQDFVSLSGVRGFTNAVAEVSVEQDAAVDLVLLQRENTATFHISNLEVRLARDARFACHTLTFGGGLVRNDLNAVLEDEGASLRLEGLTVAGGEQRVDNHSVVDHALPRGESRQRYKSVLGGRSRGGLEAA